MDFLYTLLQITRDVLKIIYITTIRIGWKSRYNSKCRIKECHMKIQNQQFIEDHQKPHFFNKQNFNRPHFFNKQNFNRLESTRSTLSH